jgi:hypothetical protein
MNKNSDFYLFHVDAVLIDLVFKKRKIVLFDDPVFFFTEGVAIGSGHNALVGFGVVKIYFKAFWN